MFCFLYIRTDRGTLLPAKGIPGIPSFPSIQPGGERERERERETRGDGWDGEGEERWKISVGRGGKKESTPGGEMIGMSAQSRTQGLKQRKMLVLEIS